MTQLLHVLLVDAQAGVHESLEPRLKRTGYRTTLARDGVGALETARRDPPDLIVLDGSAPGENCQQTCRELKRLRPELPVIIYQGEGTANAENDTTDCGADELVARPADPALVMQKIVQLLHR